MVEGFNTKQIIILITTNNLTSAQFKFVNKITIKTQLKIATKRLKKIVTNLVR